jgi:putative transposase
VACRSGLCRPHGISEQTCYRWKKRFGDLGTAEVRELRHLREENRKLEQVVADLTLDKTILKEALGKKWYPPGVRAHPPRRVSPPGSPPGTCGRRNRHGDEHPAVRRGGKRPPPLSRPHPSHVRAVRSGRSLDHLIPGVWGPSRPDSPASAQTEHLPIYKGACDPYLSLARRWRSSAAPTGTGSARSSGLRRVRRMPVPLTSICQSRAPSSQAYE